MDEAHYSDIQLPVPREKLVQQDRAFHEQVLRRGLLPAFMTKGRIGNVLRRNERDHVGLVFRTEAKPSDRPGEVALISQSDNGGNE